MALGLVFSLFSCNKSPETINGYGVSHFLEQCKANSPYNLTFYKNQLGTFQMGIPDTWLVDKESGLAAMDTLAYSTDQQINTVSVSAHQLPGPINPYFETELNGLEQDFKIIEVGIAKINTLNSRWVLTEENYEEEKLVNLISYIADPNNHLIYIINISVDKTKDYKNRLCNLKKIITSFEPIN